MSSPLIPNPSRQGEGNGSPLPLGEGLGVRASVSAFGPVKIGPLTLKNRFIKAATNEGMAPGGVPSKMLVEYHRRVAAGGSALTTVAYCAVSPDGRTFPDQICLDEKTVPHLQVLTEAVHAEGGLACAQITHGGAFNFLPKLSTSTPFSSSGGFNPVGLMVWRPFKRAVTEQDMHDLADEFAQAALIAESAGFDAVEIHMGHGYLLSQFISPLYNKRRDAYGSNASKRAVFPAMVLRKVLDAVGDRMAVLCKISLIEGHRKGATIEDSIAVAKVLESTGAHMLVLSAGMNVESPWQIFGSRLPAAVSDTVANPVMRLGARLARLLEPKIEYQSMYLWDYARQIRNAVKMPLSYLGGADSLHAVETAVSEGFDGVAMGRALLHDPDLVNQFERGQTRESDCTHCNECVVSMYTPGGTYCVLNSPNDVLMNQQPAAPTS